VSKNEKSSCLPSRQWANDKCDDCSSFSTQSPWKSGSSTEPSVTARQRNSRSLPRGSFSPALEKQYFLVRICLPESLAINVYDKNTSINHEDKGRQDTEHSHKSVCRNPRNNSKPNTK
jgi:hypothetical protein